MDLASRIKQLPEDLENHVLEYAIGYSYPRSSYILYIESYTTRLKECTKCEKAWNKWVDPGYQYRLANFVFLWIKDEDYCGREDI